MAHVFADPCWRWLDAEDRELFQRRPDRPLVWRAVVTEQDGALVRTPIELRVIDRGGEGWADEARAILASSARRT